MELILIIVIGYFIYKKFIKKKTKEETNTTPPALGSKAEKKMLKEQERIQKELEKEKADLKFKFKHVTGEYGRYQIQDMKYLANAYKEGRVVEKDIEKAKYWAERAFYAMLDKKFFVSSSEGVSGYSPNIDFFLDGETKDLDKAEELAWMLYRTGTLSAKKYMLEVLKCKHPEKTEEELNVDGLFKMDGLVRAAKQERSKEVYEAFKEEMKEAGVSGQRAFVNLLMKKAEVDVNVNNVIFPGATTELDKQFALARKVEVEGKDFTKVISAYEPVAQAGHSEAMRRMGLIMRDVVAEDMYAESYIKGQEWIEKAAVAGNSIAAYNLNGKIEDMAFIVGLAGQGNLDALYILGCTFEKENWEVSQSFFRNMEELIGDPIRDKNGEGIEWLYKLGPKFFNYSLSYYEKLAKAGHEIGYALCTVRLILMSHLMLEGAITAYGNKAGEYGDFGFAKYVERVAEKAIQGGVARAKAISKALSSDGFSYSSYRRAELECAEKGTGSWRYAGANLSPQQRVSREAALLHEKALAMYYTRKYFGMNYSEIYKQLSDSKDFDAIAQSVMTQLQERAPKKTSESKTGGLQLQNVLDLPDVIHGPYNNTYIQFSISSSSAQYQCVETREIVTINNGDISGMHARNADGYFWWN